MKEPFYQSLRWWASVLATPVAFLVAAAFAWLAGNVPFFTALGIDQQLVTDNMVELIAGQIVLAIAFIAARTARNTA